jgi:hypothetical protein
MRFVKLLRNNAARASNTSDKATWPAINPHEKTSAQRRGHCAAALLQRWREIEAGRLEGRKGSEQKRCEKREGERKGEDPRIGRDAYWGMG